MAFDFAFQTVNRAAVRAFGGAVGLNRQENARMAVPRFVFRAGTVQGQIVRGDNDSGGLVAHRVSFFIICVAAGAGGQLDFRCCINSRHGTPCLLNFKVPEADYSLEYEVLPPNRFKNTGIPANLGGCGKACFRPSENRRGGREGRIVMQTASRFLCYKRGKSFKLLYPQQPLQTACCFSASRTIRTRSM